MRRRILGLSALVLLVAAVAIQIWWPSDEATLAWCWRGGAILAAGWLAFEDVQRLPNWLVICLPVALILLVRWPRVLLAILPILIGVAFLRRFLFAGNAGPRG